MQDNRTKIFLKKYLILFNNFLNDLEQSNDTKLIFHGQMLHDRLEFYLKKNYNN